MKKAEKFEEKRIKGVYKMKIKLYNKIAKCGLDTLPDTFTVGEDLTEEDGILVRSADLHETPFPPTLRAIARAGAGVNNIPLEACTEKGIAVFNTPGANANAVKELVLCALLLSSRRIPAALRYCETLAGDSEALKKIEKEKGKFVGPELYGKTLGIVGLGAIGRAVAECALSLGMKVIGHDPFAPDGYWVEQVSLDTLFAESDYITLHVPSLPTTRGMLCRENLAKMKDGVRLLNLARADLAVDEDILAGLESGKIASYYTDFPTGNLAGKEGVIATPHLGASTPEAEDNCAVMAAKSLSEYLTNGNIINSVNLPSLTMEREKAYRVGILAKEGCDVSAYLQGAKIAQNTRFGLTYLLCERDSAFDVSSITSVGGVLRVTSY